MSRPKIVCLCGSTRFKAAYLSANFDETMKGNIVLSVGFYANADNIRITEKQKIALDKLHFEKIKLADEILVLNVGGYIGYSTGNEIIFARRRNKVIKYLEEDSNGEIK